MRKYRKRLISICIGMTICTMTAFVPAAASQEAVTSGEELLYKEESAENTGSGELANSGLSSSITPTTEPTTPPTTKPTTPPTTEPTTPPPTEPPTTKPTTPPTTEPTEPPTTEPTTPAPTTTTEEPTTESETEEEKIFVELFNGTKLEIEKTIDESKIPEDFNLTTYSYKGSEIEIAESKSGLILFYLRDDGETANFYIYNEGKDSCIPYVKINSSVNQYVFLDLEESSKELDGLKATKISVNGKTLPAWKPAEGETPKEDYIVYLMDQENIRGLYHVNIETGVIESYQGQDLNSTDDASGETVGDAVLGEDTSDRDEMLRKIAIFGGAAVGIVILTIAGIVLYRYLKKKIDQPEDDDDLYDEEDDLYNEEDDLFEDDDEEFERAFESFEQEEWNKGNFDDEEVDMQEQGAFPQEEELSQEPQEKNSEGSNQVPEEIEDKEPEVDLESLNKKFNDLASEKSKEDIEEKTVKSLKKTKSENIDVDNFQMETAKELKRNLQEMLDDDDDFEITDFKE